MPTPGFNFNIDNLKTSPQEKKRTSYGHLRGPDTTRGKCVDFGAIVVIRTMGFEPEGGVRVRVASALDWKVKLGLGDVSRWKHCDRTRECVGQRGILGLWSDLSCTLMSSPSCDFLLSSDQRY